MIGRRRALLRRLESSSGDSRRGSEMAKGILRRLRSTHGDSSTTDPATLMLQRVCRVFVDACDEIMRGPRTILIPMLGVIGALRREAVRVRSRLGGASADMLTAPVVAAGSVIAVAALAASILASSGVGDARSALTAAHTEQRYPTLSAADADTPSPTAISQGGARSNERPPVLAGVLRVAAPHASASASGALERDDKRINVTGKVTAWLGPAGTIIDGPILWIDCDPGSTVRTAACAAVDFIPAPPDGS